MTTLLGGELRDLKSCESLDRIARTCRERKETRVERNFISNRDCTIRTKDTSLGREEQKRFGGSFEGDGEDHRSD